MFEKMIVGFDGSDTAHDGLTLATGLAKVLGSQILVAYIYDADLSASSEQAAAELSEHADAVLAGAREHRSAMLKMDFRGLPGGSPAQALYTLAVDERADLIVLGSRRLGPMTTVALGSVSAHLLRAAPFAVAIAPRGYRASGGVVPQKIGVGWVPTEEGDHALETAFEIARATGGSVEVVTATSAEHKLADLEHRAEKRAATMAASVNARVPFGVRVRVARAAVELAERSKEMDLIVLGSRRFTTESPGMLGTVSSRVVHEAHCPTLLLTTRPVGVT